jgi:hypothetical protein
MATKPFVNMVEFERSVLVRHRLDGRFHSVEVLRPGVEAREEESNLRIAEMERQFTTEDARIKLRRLYPAKRYWRTTMGMK